MYCILVTQIEAAFELFYFIWIYKINNFSPNKRQEIDHYSPEQSQAMLNLIFSR